MAKNLQSKLKPSDKVAIFDVNPTAMEGLGAEMKPASEGAAVELAASAHDASKDAVSGTNGVWASFSSLLCLMPECHRDCFMRSGFSCERWLGYMIQKPILWMPSLTHIPILFTSFN